MCIATFAGILAANNRYTYCGDKNNINALRRGSTHTGVLCTVFFFIKFTLKIINMKTKIILLFVLFSLFSCNSYFDKNKFIVETIYQSNKQLCTYKVVLDCSTAEKFLRSNHFEVVDSVGKFQVGDTLRLSFLK